MDRRRPRSWLAATAAFVFAGVVIQLFVTADNATFFFGVMSLARARFASGTMGHG
jgi:hypothetical protein